MAVKDHRLNAVAHEDVRAAQSGGPRADDGDALAGGAHVRHVGCPAAPEGFIGDVLLYRADGDGAQAVIQRAGTLAQSILWTDAPAHLRQGIGLVRKLRGLEEIALLDGLPPMG